jgi:lipoate synthase
MAMAKIDQNEFAQEVTTLLKSYGVTQVNKDAVMEGSAIILIGNIKHIRAAQPKVNLSKIKYDLTKCYGELEATLHRWNTDHVDSERAAFEILTLVAKHLEKQNGVG